jgi:hypothetical protein
MAINMAVVNNMTVTYAFIVYLPIPKCLRPMPPYGIVDGM